MKQDFVYHGPTTSFAFADPKGAVLWEGTAHDGRQLKGLPADHPHVESLIAAGRLTRVGEPARVRDAGEPEVATPTPTKKGK